MTRVRMALWMSCLVAACGGPRYTRPAPAPDPLPPPAAPPAAPPPISAAAQPLPVYTLDEVLADVLSGPLQYIGTGPWHGIARSHACAYRNERVIVVDVYCTIKEGKAARIDIFSPTRGRARLYAEASVPITQVTRSAYFSFVGEAQPAPLRRERLPALRLTMTLPELQDYERQRYEKFLPACFGGVENQRPQGGCMGELAPHANRWARRNQAFLNQPPPEWYRLLQDLRALAVQYGRDR